MKKTLFSILLFSSFSTTAMAEYTCYPSKTNKFSTNIIVAKELSRKIRLTELNDASEAIMVGEAKLHDDAMASDGQDVQFDHSLYTSIKLIKKDENSFPSTWFGEGQGNVHFESTDSSKKRMAISWCNGWCRYAYFTCYPKK